MKVFPLEIEIINLSIRPLYSEWKTSQKGKWLLHWKSKGLAREYHQTREEWIEKLSWIMFYDLYRSAIELLRWVKPFIFTKQVIFLKSSKKIYIYIFFFFFFFFGDSLIEYKFQMIYYCKFVKDTTASVKYRDLRFMLVRCALDAITKCDYLSIFILLNTFWNELTKWKLANWYMVVSLQFIFHILYIKHWIAFYITLQSDFESCL